MLWAWTSTLFNPLWISPLLAQGSPETGYDSFGGAISSSQCDLAGQAESAPLFSQPLTVGLTLPQNGGSAVLGAINANGYFNSASVGQAYLLKTFLPEELSEAFAQAIINTTYMGIPYSAINVANEMGRLLAEKMVNQHNSAMEQACAVVSCGSNCEPGTHVDPKSKDCYPIITCCACAIQSASCYYNFFGTVPDGSGDQPDPRGEDEGSFPISGGGPIGGLAGDSKFQLPYGVEWVYKKYQEPGQSGDLEPATFGLAPFTLQSKFFDPSPAAIGFGMCVPTSGSVTTGNVTKPCGPQEGCGDGESCVAYGEIKKGLGLGQPAIVVPMAGLPACASSSCWCGGYWRVLYISDADLTIAELSGILGS